ncbi:MAG: Eco57I restriction-modification methylase domain-containing protein [Fibrobacter sp.]|nr:Eco57I restriction-modification methylase domain-containing protein [Fibrobacter sp.]
MGYQTSFFKVIYAFRIPDKAHKGCIKVGDASLADFGDISNNSPALNKAAKERINQYTRTAGVKYELLHTEIAFYTKGKTKKIIGFRDNDVHEVLKRSGIAKKDFNIEAKSDEWFITDLETVRKAITAVKEGRKALDAGEITQDRSPVEFRPEQIDAIEKTVKRFKKHNNMLWNAKMRFGKTLSALEVVKRCNFKRTLILTHRPVVNEGWFEDFMKIFYDRDDYFKYGSKNKGNTFNLLERNAQKGAGRYVYFASMQDLRGSERVGGNFDKNQDIFKTKWDCVIVDEAHEGTKTELGEAVINELVKKDTKLLKLSGTPFNLLNDYEESEIFTWDYVMEQKAKAEWDLTHFGDPNPYSSLPKLNIYTFDLGKLVANFSDSDLAFNFYEFFRCNDDGEFIHYENVRSFLNLICKKDDKSNYPYSTEEFRKNFRHSLWMVPGVAAAKALSKMLKEHKVFGNFDIVNVAGDGDEEEEHEEALKKVRKAIGDDPEATYTITLSCGRLTTGVTVPEWTAVFMLAGTANTGAANYMQTIFRVQSPATINGRVKEECFVFDFAPDRTLKVLAQTAKISARVGRTTTNDRIIMGDFLNFCPVISFDGTCMKTFDVDKMLGQLKRVYVERVVRNGFEDGCLYNDELLKLDKNALKAFDELKKIIGTTKAMPKAGDIDVNNMGLTDEEYEKLVGKGGKKKKKELTKKEKELLEKRMQARKVRDTAISILRGISIRMPLMIYGADLQNETEQITIDNFTRLVDDVSWKEFMPRGVTKKKFNEFKKYYEADIFREAGIRIREMARAADQLSVEERIGRVADIFNNFRNPDKETVLTPWRVVNMHIGGALGGFVFFDDSFEDNNILSNPRFIDNGKITKDVFDVDSRILEINSKSGLYPLYMAYTIYRNEVKRIHERMNTISSDMQKKLWDKVVADNIFVVCKTPMAVSITKRTLMGFRTGRVNAKYFEDLETVISEEPEKFVNAVNKNTFWKNGTIKKTKEDEMKFNAVVGNPPYQITTVRTSDNPIYHEFMDVSFELSKIVSLITPGRYLFNAGKTPKDWNEKVLNDEHFKVVQYWAESTDVFPTVDIKGGVAVMLRNADEIFEKIVTYTPYAEVKCILEHVLADANFKSIDSIIYSQNKFDLKKLYKDFPKYKKIVGSNGKERRLTTSIFEQLDVFKETKKKDGDAEIIGLIKNERVNRYLPQKYLDEHANFMNYKVLLPKSNGTGAMGEALSTPLVGDPLVGYTQSFISFGCFDSKKEAKACLKYIKTQFARVMLGVLKVTQDNSREVWKYVPMQDFASNNDIDWTQSIEDIDNQLFNKYKLSKQEREFIKTHVKEMK